MYAVTCLEGKSIDAIADHDFWIDGYSNRFIIIESRCDQFLHARSLSATGTVSSNTVKLDRIKFRTFDGDVRNYAKFKLEFNKFIAPLCDKSQLSFVLKAHLCDSVRSDVELFDHDVDAMWKRLDMKYGNIQKLLDAIFTDLKNLPDCNANNNSTLNFIKLIETAYYKLDAINALPELMNYTVFSIIEQCMPSNMFDEWIQLVASMRFDDRFEKLLPFLEEWRNRIEYERSGIRNCSDDNNLTTAAATKGTTSSRTCLIHRQCEHPVWRWRVFKDMSVKRRVDIIKTAGACTLCLCEGHTLDGCPKTFKCSIPGCSQKHNFLLHDTCTA